VVEQRGSLGCGERRALQESGEVHLVGGVEHAEVLRREARELLPPAETGGRSALRELLGGPERLLHPREELTDLVGEPAETEQTAVGRPRAGVLRAEQFANLRELLGSRKDLRGLALALLEEREGERGEGRGLHGPDATGSRRQPGATAPIYRSGRGGTSPETVGTPWLRSRNHRSMSAAPIAPTRTPSSSTNPSRPAMTSKTSYSRSVGATTGVWDRGAIPSRTGRSGSREPTLRADPIDTVPITRPPLTTGNERSGFARSQRSS